MPSILLIRSSRQWGGIERQLLDHALRLRSEGWTPTLLGLFREAGEHPLVKAAKEQGLTAHTIPDPYSWHPKSLIAIRSVILALAPTWPILVITDPIS